MYLERYLFLRIWNIIYLYRFSVHLREEKSSIISVIHLLRICLLENICNCQQSLFFGSSNIKIFIIILSRSFLVHRKYC